MSRSKNCDPPHPLPSPIPIPLHPLPPPIPNPLFLLCGNDSEKERPAAYHWRDWSSGGHLEKRKTALKTKDPWNHPSLLYLVGIMKLGYNTKSVYVCMYRIFCVQLEH